MSTTTFDSADEIADFLDQYGMSNNVVRVHGVSRKAIENTKQKEF